MTRCRLLTTPILAVLLLLTSGFHSLEFAQAEPATTEVKKPACVTLIPIVDPQNHGDEAVRSNWVLGPITQRAGTVELLFFRYRQNAPVENADVGPLAVHLRASYGEADMDEPPAFRWEAQWRGKGEMPPDFATLNDWVEGVVDSQPKLLNRIFAEGNVPKERISCFAGFPGTTVHPPESKIEANSQNYPLFVVIAGIIMALLLLFYAAVPCWKAITRSTHGRQGLIFALCLTLSAFALRGLLAPASVYHENHHGFMYLEAIANGRSYIFEGFHSSFLILMHHVVTILDLAQIDVFFINAMLSALTPVLLGGIFFLITEDRWTGYLAGVIWALNGIAIRLGPTECVGNFGLFFFLLGSLCVIASIKVDLKLPRSVSNILCVAGILCIATAAQSRVLTIAYPGIALGLIFSATQRPTRRSIGVATATLIATLIVLLPWYQVLFSLIGDTNGGTPIGASCILQNLGLEFGLFFKPDVVSPTLIPLALIGAISWKGSPWQRSLLVAAIALSVALCAMVCGETISQSRFNLLPLALLSGLGSAGAVNIGRLLSQKHERSGQAFLLFCGLSPLLAGNYIQRPMQAELEYDFIVSKVIPEIEKIEGAKLLFVPTPTDPIMPIPRSWWLRNLSETEIRGALENDAPTSPTPLLYVGLGCHWQGKYRQAGSTELKPSECIRALSSGDWEAIVETTVRRASTRGGLLTFAKDHVKLGLYRNSGD